MNKLYIGWAVLLFAGCSKPTLISAPTATPSGKLSRYNLELSDYDVLPVTTFSLSYTEGTLSTVFEKSGQTLTSYSLRSEGGRLVSSVTNSLGSQAISYNELGEAQQVLYTTPTDTGKLVYRYDDSGKLIALLDSVKQPLKLPIRLLYTYLYDRAGSNVVQITKNQLDLGGRATLRGYSFFTFDDKLNPLFGFPALTNAAKLPGDVPAILNKNNVTSTQIVGTILNTLSGGSVPTLDTITTYRSRRSYQYDAGGHPIRAVETFSDAEFSFSGKRSFTYDY